MIVGENYFVRTDTDYWVGRLLSIEGPYSITLVDFSWVPDTGRLSEFLAGAPPRENEPAPLGMTNEITAARSVISWPYPLIREVI